MNAKTNAANSEAASHAGPKHIIVAEDDAEMRRLISLTLRQDGYEVVECSNGVELVDHLTQYSNQGDPYVDLIISDVRMPGVTGLEVLEGLREEQSPPPVILITAFGDKATHDEANRLGAAATLDKPFSMNVLVELVRDMVPI